MSGVIPASPSAPTPPSKGCEHTSIRQASQMHKPDAHTTRSVQETPGSSEEDTDKEKSCSQVGVGKRSRGKRSSKPGLTDTGPTAGSAPPAKSPPEDPTTTPSTPDTSVDTEGTDDSNNTVSSEARLKLWPKLPKQL